jgi:hypothetical protein
MQSAQKSQDIDPDEVGIAPRQRESLFGYQRIAKEVIASIEDRLDELTSRHSSGAPQVTSWSPLGSGVLRGVIGLLVVLGIIAGVLVWQWPRNETVRSMLARSTPQPVLDLLTDRQEATAEPSAPAADAGMRVESSYRTTADNNNDAANGAAASVDQSQVVQRMARDIATLQQGIEQIRAGQDQMLRMMMRPSGLNAQARTAAAAPRAIATQQTIGLAAPPPPRPRRPPVLGPPSLLQQ